MTASLPAWGAWIEILANSSWVPRILGRSPHGERGLKFSIFRTIQGIFGRSPHGERGLK